ncbi:MAG: GerMN domain-containing protein [Clostridiales bacterium]|jgi:spore germination protein GerM|nr:GerMN domain-containing protein [Clostridiales bacterium]
MRRLLLLLSTIFIMLLLVACSVSNILKEPEKDEDKKISGLGSSLGDDIPEAALSEDKDGGDEIDPSRLSLNKTGINLYFYDKTTEQLSPESRTILTTRIGPEALEYVLNELIEGPKEAEQLVSALSKDTEIKSVEISEDIVTVDMSEKFYESEDMALARACLVNTILDFVNADYVKLMVEGWEATAFIDNREVMLGLLTRYPMTHTEIQALEAQTFGNPEISRINRELYFQDYSGKFLLPEVRSITVRNGNYAEAIINELIKGPVSEGQGYYPTLPKGSMLHKTEIVSDENDRNGIALYFSKEFSSKVSKGTTQEISMLSSLLYSLSSLPDIHYLNIYYDNGHGTYINAPIEKINLDRNLTVDLFPNKVGKRIRVYFGDSQGMLLVPEYRAVPKNEKNMAKRIMSELATDPIHQGCVRVIPENISPDEIKVEVKDGLAVVDIPNEYYEELELSENRIIRDIYAVVNTLTDPENSCYINKVQFTAEGKKIDNFKDVSLSEPFVMNLALIKEEK